MNFNILVYLPSKIYLFIYAVNISIDNMRFQKGKHGKKLRYVCE